MTRRRRDHTPSTSNRRTDIGLVLVGGGAKGAYQAGALRYLNEVGFVPHAIAGTSIGALNGAVLASHRSFTEGVERLDALWTRIAQQGILQLNPGSIIDQAFEQVDHVFNVQPLLNAISVFDIRPIEMLLREAVKIPVLRSGIPLWVTIFPALKRLSATLRRRGININQLPITHRENAKTGALWVRIQDLDEDQIHNALLASAAIPLIFPVRRVAGGFFVDGGFGDNTPLGALTPDVCRKVCVIHLSDGSTWSRHDFPNQTVIEIRPEEPFSRSTTVLADLYNLLDFSHDRIMELRIRGYRDARRCWQDITRAENAVGMLRKARQEGMLLIDDLHAEHQYPL